MLSNAQDATMFNEIKAFSGCQRTNGSQSRILTELCKTGNRQNFRHYQNTMVGRLTPALGGCRACYHVNARISMQMHALSG